MSEGISSGLVLKDPSYVEESTYGTFPTNPSLQWIGNTARLTTRFDQDTHILPQPESEDPKFIVRSRERPEWTLTYSLQNSTFAKYGINAVGGGAGSIDKSLSLLASAKLGGSLGTENYLRLLGTRINRLSFRGSPRRETLVEASLWGREYPVPTTTSPIGSGSFATDPGGNAWIWSDGGANPITIGSATPDVQEFEAVFERGLTRLYPPEDTKQKLLPSTTRSITGRFSLLWRDTAQYTNLSNDTALTITWVLKTGVSTLTLTGCKLRLLRHLEFTTGTNPIFEAYDFNALTASLT